MQDFNVLALAEHLSDEELDVVVASFSTLYHRVTFKHHKRIKLKVVCSMDRAEQILTLARIHKVGTNVEMIPASESFDQDLDAGDVSVLFLPTQKRLGKVTRKALAHSIPIVSFENESISEYIDQSCGMLVRKRGTGQDKDAFSRILSMLYFDPEVRKLLKKGAARKYREISGFRPSTNTVISRSYQSVVR